MAQEKSPDIDQQVERLLQKMTLTEKIGQMNQYSGTREATGPIPTRGNKDLKYQHLKSGKVGSVLNVKGVKAVREMQRLAVEESRLGIPLLFGYDVIHGHKTLSPVPLAEAASWDLKAIEISARIAATEATAVGLNWTFAPMVDISRDARWGRVMEGAGEDPYLGSQIAAARVKGYQGEDLSRPDTMLATAKHFAAYGFAEAGREYNTVDIGTLTLYNLVFPPFRAALQAGARSVMNAFNILNGVPASGDAFLMRDILKSKWKFEGIVVSDWNSIGEMVQHGYSEDLQQAAIQAAQAGCDIDMESYAYIQYLEEAVKNGAVDEALIDDAVRRILKVKFELGLFDDPYRYCDEAGERELLYHTDHMAAALDMAKRSIVLLKNEAQSLPLKTDQKGIALIGALAAEKTSPLGSWRLGSDDETAISVLEGFDALGIEYTYAKGADLALGPVDFIEEVTINETDQSGFAEAIAVAKRAEVVIMVLGEHGFQSGEGRSRTQLGLPGVQQALLEAVYAANPHIVLVLMNGRPLVLNWADAYLPAIVEAWQLGTQSGHAIAEVLFGNYNPSGKLPMSFPRSIGQIPIYYNHYATGRPVQRPDDGEVFWSHYIDEANTPLYPFGYGLSYTRFEYSGLEIDSQSDDEVLVKVTVTNTGTFGGEEVAQLYIRDRVASVARPVKELKGFEKFYLAPGASREVVFMLTPKELGFYNGKGDFVVESGTFDIMVGGDSLAGLSKPLNYLKRVY